MGALSAWLHAGAFRHLARGVTAFGEAGNDLVTVFLKHAGYGMPHVAHGDDGDSFSDHEAVLWLRTNGNVLSLFG